MLKHISLVITIALISCSANQSKSQPNAQRSIKCPENVNCYVEVKKDTSLLIKKDGTGQVYIQFAEKKGVNTISHIYDYAGKPELADDGYTEKVYFELEAGTKNLNLVDEELDSSKLIIEKGCFCRDAGYELITNGKLSLSETKTGYHVEVSYTTDKNMKLNSLYFDITD